MPSIVTLNTSVVTAAAPLTLQATGALISQGGTTLSAGKFSLLTQASDLTPLLAAAASLTSLAWSGGVVTATTAVAIPGLTAGDTFITTISGATPSAYDGTFMATVTGASTFTYALVANPGSETVAGTYTPPNQGELQAMVNTFFGQGTGQSVYVLELGPGDATSGPTALGTWLTANPRTIYSFLIPRLWDNSAGLLTLIAQYEAPNALTYFFVTTTPSTNTAYTATMKNVFALVEAPTIPLTEFSLAAVFQVTLQYAPSATNRQTQLGFAYLYGVTPYPTTGNNALLASFKAANTNYVGTGAEGGISTSVLFWGNVASGVDFTWWYSADWAQINSDQTAANIVINGSNNPLNPLLYNQSGINTLQDGIVNLIKNAVSFGLAAGTVVHSALSAQAFSTAVADEQFAGNCVVNAVPYATYIAQNPNDYAIGKYGGLSVLYIPQNGFKQIIFNVTVTNLIG
jgi:hypothetical protein